MAMLMMLLSISISPASLNPPTKSQNSGPTTKGGSVSQLGISPRRQSVTADTRAIPNAANSPKNRALGMESDSMLPPAPQVVERRLSCRGS